ncbi:MAG: hypothetical protein K2M88_00590 [Muribaculaceae bacterium]|nr:hypothetical protein [Muribaculaceae bacterium]
MKKFISILSLSSLAVMPALAAEASDSRILNIFDKAVFYDGYNSNIFDADKQDGIIRHSNYLYAKKLSEQQLDQFGEDLRFNATIGALCDNYDRFGNVNLALVPKGAESYKPEDVERIELARFITPFMNKNKAPYEVPYTWVDNKASLIFRDANLREKYDFYLELEVFGVPYSANTQVKGCSGRNDVFAGSFSFETSGVPASKTYKHHLIPIVIKKPETIGHNLNNYSEAGTDTIGTCTKTYTFIAPEDMADACIKLVMSNHGANEDGEEYVRRKHLIYFDNELTEVFTPGGKTCEPYRIYNTQRNMIYGDTPEDDWEEWSNWCPGDIIPIRELPLGALKAGEHKIMIRVPDAVFASKQGDFPVSIYVQGVTDGSLPAGIENINYKADISMSVVGETLYLGGEEKASSLEIYDAAGTLCYGTFHPTAEVNLAMLGSGVYVAVASTADGRLNFVKFAR